MARRFPSSMADPNVNHAQAPAAADGVVAALPVGGTKSVASLSRASADTRAPRVASPEPLTARAPGEPSPRVLALGFLVVLALAAVTVVLVRGGDDPGDPAHGLARPPAVPPVAAAPVPRGWESVTGLLRQISVGSANIVWGVNSNQQVYRWASTRWRLVPGKLSTVSVGADGTAWGVDPQGNVQRWQSNRWENAPGKLRSIAVGSRDHVWGIDRSSRVHRWTGSEWEPVAGQLREISVGVDGAVWGIDLEQRAVRWDHGEWIVMRPGMRAVAVRNAREVWLLDTDRHLLRYVQAAALAQDAGAEAVDASDADATAGAKDGAEAARGAVDAIDEQGAMDTIAAGADGSVWGLASDDRVYRLVTSRGTSPLGAP